MSARYGKVRLESVGQDTSPQGIAKDRSPRGIAKVTLPQDFARCPRHEAGTRGCREGHVATRHCEGPTRSPTVAASASAPWTVCCALLAAAAGESMHPAVRSFSRRAKRTLLQCPSTQVYLVDLHSNRRGNAGIKNPPFRGL